MAANPGESQAVLVLAGTRVAFEAYLLSVWGVDVPPGHRTVDVGRFHFVRVMFPQDAQGYDHTTPYLLLDGWSRLPLPVLKAVLDRYETRFGGKEEERCSRRR